MAATNTTLTAGQRSAHAITLTADTADSVTFTGYFTYVEVDSLDGTDRLYVTVDGSTATVGSATSYVLPATISTRRIPIPASKRKNPVVSLISHGATTYSVTGLDPEDE